MNENAMSVRVAKAILAATSERSPLCPRRGITAVISLERSGGSGKTPERIRAAVKMLSDQGWIESHTNTSGTPMVRVLDRRSLSEWLANDAPMLARKPSSQAEGRACRQKIRHETEADALAHASNVYGTTYECRYCNGFHVTTKT